MGNKSSRLKLGTKLAGKKRRFGTECCICMQQLDGALGQGGAPGEGTPGQVTCLPCQHEFHQDCWKKWRKQKRTCPTCRHRVPPSHQQHQQNSQQQQNSQHNSQQQQNSQQQNSQQQQQRYAPILQRSRSRRDRYERGRNNLWARIRNNLEQRLQAGEDDSVSLLADRFEIILNALGPELVELLEREALARAPAMVMVLNAQLSVASGFRAIDECIFIDPCRMRRQAVRQLAADLGAVGDAVRQHQQPRHVTVPFSPELMDPEVRTAFWNVNGIQPDLMPSLVVERELPIDLPVGISAFVAAVLPHALDPGLDARQDLDQIATNGSQRAANEAREAIALPPSHQQPQQNSQQQQNSQHNSQQQQNSQQQNSQQQQQRYAPILQRSRSRRDRYERGRNNLWARIRNNLEQRLQAGEDDSVSLLADRFEIILNALGPELVELLEREALARAPAMVMVLNAQLSVASGFRAIDECIFIDPCRMRRQAVRQLAADLGAVGDAVRQHQQPRHVTVPFSPELMDPEVRTAFWNVNGIQPDLMPSLVVERELPIDLPVGISAFVAAVLPHALDPGLDARQDLDQIATNGSSSAANEAREALAP